MLISGLRALEALTFQAAGRRWRIDRFNRMIDRDVRETSRLLNASAAVAIVGIPFYRETSNITHLVEVLQTDLRVRPRHTAILIVAEPKSKDALFSLPLPPSTPSVTVVRLAKPVGFGQKPGLSRRSWSHWFILQIARHCSAHVVFIDADVRNAEGWVNLYLDAIERDSAAVVVADYVRRFGSDDAMVHIWDRLIFGALFRKWVAFRQGGDYAISRDFVRAIAIDHTILREKTYTLDSAVIARAVSAGQRVDSVWLGVKGHEPISPARLFQRLPDFVRSVFDDVAAHLPKLLRFRHAAVPEAMNPRAAVPMIDLIGPTFRHDLHADIASRFTAVALTLRRAAGSTHFDTLAALVAAPSPQDIYWSPRLWARLTVRFLMRYIRNPDASLRNQLVHAYVPVLELGVLGFLNETSGMRYDQALDHLERDYLPQFQQIWDSLARRLPVYRWMLLRRLPRTLAGRIHLFLRRPI